jgi:hypothetical protein
MGHEIGDYKGYTIDADDYGWVRVFKDGKLVKEQKGCFRDGYDIIDMLEEK